MDTVEIMGKKIPVYGILGAIGIVLGIIYLWIVCRKNKKSVEDSLYIFIWSCLFAMIGAKLLYLLLEFRNIVCLLQQYPDKTGEIIWGYISGGFVFYGGLFGAIVGVVISSKYFSLNPFEQLNLCVPIMPLVHGFGRIGCNLVGCCYGIEYEGPLSRVYEHSSFAPNGVGLFPVQLVESAFDFVLFFAFIILGTKKKHKESYLYIYLVSYSIERFILEFFRGDLYRGMLLGLSTSQWISMAILILVAVQIGAGKKKTKP